MAPEATHIPDGRKFFLHGHESLAYDIAHFFSQCIDIDVFHIIQRGDGRCTTYRVARVGTPDGRGFTGIHNDALPITQPIGMPLPILFAQVEISGTTSKCWYAAHFRFVQTHSVLRPGLTEFPAGRRSCANPADIFPVPH